jgi:hypothetical protein
MRPVIVRALLVPFLIDPHQSPIILTLLEEGFHKEPAGITENRDEQKDADDGAADVDALLAEIDLQLGAGRRFHEHRRNVRRPLRLPLGCDRSLGPCAAR